MCGFASRFGEGCEMFGSSEVEGKIEGRGTRQGLRPCLHVGWRGTPRVTSRAASVGIGRKEKDLPRASPHDLRRSLIHGAV